MADRPPLPLPPLPLFSWRATMAAYRPLAGAEFHQDDERLDRPLTSAPQRGPGSGRVGATLMHEQV